MIEVRSPYVARGYAEGGGPLRVVDGWAGVGDRGRLGEDGLLTVDGRGDDALTVGGATVLVADVERVLGAVDGVLEVACVGEAHPDLGERAVAAVRPEAGADAEALVRAAPGRGPPQSPAGGAAGALPRHRRPPHHVGGQDRPDAAAADAGGDDLTPAGGRGVPSPA